MIDLQKVELCTKDLSCLHQHWAITIQKMQQTLKWEILRGALDDLTYPPV